MNLKLNKKYYLLLIPIFLLIAFYLNHQYKEIFVVCDNFQYPKRSQKLETTYFSWNKKHIKKYHNKGSTNYIIWNTTLINEDLILGKGDDDYENKISLDRVTGKIETMFSILNKMSKNNYYNCRQIEKKIFESRRF